METCFRDKIILVKSVTPELAELGDRSRLTAYAGKIVMDEEMETQNPWARVVQVEGVREPGHGRVAVQGSGKPQSLGNT